MKKLLIIILLLGIVLAPVGAGVAHAGAAGEVIGAVAGFFSVGDQITFAFAEVGNAILTLVSKVLDIAGAVLNFSVEKTINMSEFLAQVKIVDVGWKVFRDIANLFFIFVLLWIGIRTILGLGGGEIKKLLLNVIIMALLINFSLFITKAIVDAGNIATIHFYDAMRPDLIENGKVVGKAGLSDIYMEALKMQTFMGTGSSVTDAMASAGGFTSQFIKIFVATTLGSVFFLVAAFVFFAAAVLFIIRAVVLMLLMLLSPLAFVAHIVPNMQGLANKWWKELFCQTFFAPLYMALTYVVAKAIQSGGFGTLLNITGNHASFAALLTADASENVGIVVNYIILIILMAATLKIASDMGAVGSKMVMGWGKGLQKWGQGAVTGLAGGVAARVLGGAAKAATGGLQGSTSAFGRAALRTADRLQNLKIGGKSYKEQQEKGTFFQVGEEEAEKNLLKGMKGKPGDQATYLAKLNPKMQEKMYEKMSARDRAAVETEGVKSGAFTAKRFDDMKKKMSIEEQEKTDKAKKEARKDTEATKRETDLEAISKETNLAELAQRASEAKATGTALNAKDDADLNKLKSILTQISDKEATQLGHEVATAIAPFLKSGQYMAIQGSDQLGDAEKNAVEMARYSTFTTNVMRAQNMTLPATERANAAAAVQEDMKEYKPKERANMDENTLLRQEVVISQLTKQDMMEMGKQNKIADATWNAISGTIDGWRGRGGLTANQQRLAQFRTSDPGKDLFGAPPPPRPSPGSVI